MQIGLSLVALLGLAGLGSEGAYFLYEQRHMQSASDSAALSAVQALQQAFPRDYQSEGRAVAARLGFTHGADGTTVTVNNPPLSGSQAGNSGAVEVIINRPFGVALLRVVYGNPTVNVGTRAVAVKNSQGEACVVALDPHAEEALYLSNNAFYGGNHCNVWVNSDSPRAVYMRNNSTVQATLTAPLGDGGTDLRPGATIDSVQPGPAIADPYANLSAGDPGPCTTQVGEYKQNDPIPPYFDPGHFCSGWDFKNGATINLYRGIYYIDSKLNLGQDHVEINGTGVTIVLTSDFAIDIGNNVTFNLSAPTEGPTAGIVFFGPRLDAPSSTIQKFSNNTAFDTGGIRGDLYFPSQTVEFDNNSAGTGGCTRLIANKIRMMNNVALENNCQGVGNQPIMAYARLVE